ncbi:beta-ketoacyl synthase N-terminal-like domain-containing protein [Streptomyces sp. P1-3]|uniref:beta-ketoacyl synthase N-terminal-like domain-containing protein n=1 Tax=Streptomyces sp. P1-3 TaxID=3421658 RepID=UPI003D36927E
MSGGRDLVVTGVGVVDAEGFDHRTALGRRGYKYLPTATQYFLAAAKRALESAGQDSLEAVHPELRGAAVGTNSAAEALHDRMDRTVLQTSAADLSPALAPYFSINLFGSRPATEYALKGFNITLVGPRVAGFDALGTGQRCVALGRADWLLAGATEEALPPTEPGADASEAGAVALVLEPAAAVAARGGAAYGRVAARSFFLPPRAAHDATLARELVDGALKELGHGLDTGLAATAVLDDSPVGRAVATALGGGTTHVPARAGCLEPVLRVAAALRAGGDRPSAVVTAAAEGNVAVCLVTPGGGPETDTGHKPGTDHKR